MMEKYNERLPESYRRALNGLDEDEKKLEEKYGCVVERIQASHDQGETKAFYYITFTEKVPDEFFRDHGPFNLIGQHIIWHTKYIVFHAEVLSIDH